MGFTTETFLVPWPTPLSLAGLRQGRLEACAAQRLRRHADHRALDGLSADLLDDDFQGPG